MSDDLRRSTAPGMQARSAQKYARTAGALLLISIVVGFFGEIYVPFKILVANDAAATAYNIHVSGGLFRLGFAAYLLEAACDIGLTLLLYVLLRPVNRNIALLSVLFRVVSTATFAFAELFYFAAAVILRGDYLKAFSPAQVNSLAMLSLKLYGYGGSLFMVFYGIAAIFFGYLIFRSAYLPKFLGVLWALGGLGFVVRNFALVLAPAYASDALLPLMALATLALMLWFFVKGVDASRWNQRIASAESEV